MLQFEKIDLNVASLRDIKASAAHVLLLAYFLLGIYRNMQNFEVNDLWIFEFGLQGDPDGVVPRDKAEQLMSTIIQWAEANNLLVGGGFRVPTELENTPGSEDYPVHLLYPLLPEDDETL